MGIIATLAWLVLVALLLLADPASTARMSPNEWGDFLAGAFAPLAFFWLVLGYLQQGEELRLSTEALRLQAEELKNSVEQQRALVDVSRQQVQAERDALAHERKLREDLSVPRVAFREDGGTFGPGGRSVYGFNVSNAGHAATEVRIVAEYTNGERTVFTNAPLFEKGAQWHFNVNRDEPLPALAGEIIVEYTDGLGRRNAERFHFGRASEDPQSLVAFSRAEA